MAGKSKCPKCGQPVGIAELMAFARNYAELSPAIRRRQIEYLFGDRGDRFYFAKPKSIELVRDRLGGLNEEFDAALANYFDWLANEEVLPET